MERGNGEKIEIDRVGSYTFFNGRRSIVYEYKGDDETVLRVRDLKGKSRDIFKTGKNLFGRVWFVRREKLVLSRLLPILPG